MGSVNNISELLNILGRQFKIAQKGLKMQEIGRKYFNSAKKIEYPKHGLEIWPGFFAFRDVYTKKKTQHDISTEQEIDKN